MAIHLRELKSPKSRSRLQASKFCIFEKPKSEAAKKIIFLNFAFAGKFKNGEINRVSLPPRLLWVEESEDIHQQVKDHVQAIIPKEVGIKNL